MDEELKELIDGLERACELSDRIQEKKMRLDRNARMATFFEGVATEDIPDTYSWLALIHDIRNDLTAHIRYILKDALEAP